ncbi:arsenate reductase [Agarilytica rhodophyticola]|uniref:arsenate reductase n=1 Tax=Agarilytica rhodophyticola TaxID=1737490 RepID=UPI000B348C61|nr:arsenate reductase [Agarilytica rhodophyticola]
MTTLFGIKNCDTVKKARKWLDTNQHSFDFHDFRIDGLDEEKITHWLSYIEPAVLVNRRSTTWKQLSDAEKSYFEGDTLGQEAKQILLQQPTLLKRPILEKGEDVYVGFKEQHYSSIFS